MKTIRIILLVLILLGLGLLATQSYWLPGLVEAIIAQDEVTVVPVVNIPVPSESTATGMDEWNWVYATTSVTGTQFQYPNPFPATYVTPVDWPPVVQLSMGTFNCADATGATTSIQGQIYCVTKQSEGAAGSVYTTYQYETALDDSIATVSFILRTPQCLNYDNPEQAACTAEQSGLDIDLLADRILDSIAK